MKIETVVVAKPGITIKDLVSGTPFRWSGIILIKVDTKGSESTCLGFNPINGRLEELLPSAQVQILDAKIVIEKEE